MASRVYTREEVAKHNKASDCWVIVDNAVYNVTDYLQFHPGGKSVMIRYAGQDATDDFKMLHSDAVLRKHREKLQIGIITPDQQAKPKRGDVSLRPIQFAEPYWYYSDTPTPYYTEKHRIWKDKVRAFIDKEVAPFAREWDEAGTYPAELHEKAYQAGIYGAPWPKEYGGTPPEGGWDYFMDFIYQDEISRCRSGGVLASCFFACNIGLPPVLNFGSDFLKEKVARNVITGKEIICLAVTEPWGGSDVANIKTTARREGDYYIVSGEKKFITGGMKAQWFTTGVRTGPSDKGGMTGLSLLLIPSNLPGITTRRIPTQGWWASNTAYISFDEVKVPVSYLIGEENQGFIYIATNFNHERWAGGVFAIRQARMCLEESVRYARLRKTFGKRLIDHQVIRHKISEMARRIEANHAWAEQIAYLMQNNANPREIAGPIALFKVQTTTTAEFCARESSQIFGGNAYVRGGQGDLVERIYREIRVGAIGGGSEEILRDFAARQARL